MPQDMRPPLDDRGQLYLSDERLREAIELLFYAYRDFTEDPDRMLSELGMGRAHHRAIHFIGRNPGGAVADLLDTLRITKQSLNRVLKPLIENGFVEQRVGEADRRQRLLHLTERGEALERNLSAPQRQRVRAAFRAAGDRSVPGFLRVLELLVNDGERDSVLERVYGAKSGATTPKGNGR